jgi:DNA-binding NtrC family response regulator
LLRVLEEKLVTRVGGTVPIPVDVRVVTATNSPLKESVERGRFRSDLYYRLNVLRIYLPPLRERREDIVLLVRRFVQEFSHEHGKEFRGISPEAMQALVEYSWPGNVRELRNLVESMVVLSHGREIGLADIPRAMRDDVGDRRLPVYVGPIVREGERAEGRELEFIVRSLVELKLQVEQLRRHVDEDRDRFDGAGAERAMAIQAGLAPPPGGVMAEPGALGMGGAGGVAGASGNVLVVKPGMTMAEIERGAIEAALRETRGNRRKAAEILAIGERTLYRKLKEYNLPMGSFDSDN